MFPGAALRVGTRVAPRSSTHGYTHLMREHTGIAIAVAGVVTTVMTMFAGALVVLMWTALTIYALVKAIGSAPDAASPTAVLLIVVGLMTALALVLTLPIALVGRAMTPRKKPRKEKSDDALSVPPDTLPAP
jgi:Sec-independent protein secretion pathway component TatC